MNSYYFSSDDKNLKQSLCAALFETFGGVKPVVCCVGTDAVSGDSLGPLVGTMLSGKLLGKSYIYGTLERPITAKDVKYLRSYLKYAHSGAKILAVDAALGNFEEVGHIKLYNSSLRPGLAVNKDLSEIGDVALIGIVGTKSDKNCLSTVRLSSVYRMAGAISDGIAEYFDKIIDKTENNYSL